MPEYRIGTKRLPEPNTGPPATSKRRGYKGGKRTSFEWYDVPASEIGGLVHAVTADGCACILGRTSDGGALSITILNGDERDRLWPHTIEDFRDIAESCGSRVRPGAENAGPVPLFDEAVGAPESQSKTR